MKQIIVALSLFASTFRMSADSPLEAPAYGELKRDNPCAFAVNVKDYGAMGDWKTDDTQAFQRALNAAGLRGKKDLDNALAAPKTLVVVPPGHYRITETLVLDWRHKRLEIQGVGGVDSFGSHPALKDQRLPYGYCELIWDGMDDGTLLEMINCSGSILRNIALNGSGKAGTLLSIDSIRKDEYKGTGTSGRLAFFNMAFARAKNGIVCGARSYPNSADMSFYDCNFRNLSGACFKTCSDQNVDYTFIRPHMLFSGIGFHCERGGNLTVTMAAMMSCRIGLKVDNGGWNAGNYHFTGLHMEANSPKHGYQVAVAGGLINIVFSGLAIQNQRGPREAGFDKPLFDLDNGASVVVIGGMINNAPIAHLKPTRSAMYSPTFISFYNCRMPVTFTDRQAIVTEGRSGFSLTNCFVGNKFVERFVELPDGEKASSPYDLQD
ncbi:MAG: glycoside hydrolase family 55 protein [Candidatus Pacebacteria bacterium]|nr:glycoside hydrolase family 55 protein [Candidatus Paceibacterota bacterium]